MERVNFLVGNRQTYRRLMDQKLRPAMEVEVTFLRKGLSDIKVPSKVLERYKEFSEADPLSRRLPRETLNLYLIDPDGQYNFGEQSSLIPEFTTDIEVRLDYTLYDDSDSVAVKFWKRLWYVREKPVHEGFRTTLKCCGIFERMNDTQFYKCEATALSTTVGAFTKKILADASTALTIPGIKQVPNSRVDGLSIKERLPITTHAQAIQTICNSLSQGIRVLSTTEYSVERMDPLAIPDDPTFKHYNILRNGLRKSLTPLLSTMEVFWYADDTSSQNLEDITTFEVDAKTDDYHAEFASAQLSPYVDTPSTTGKLYRNAADIHRLVRGGSAPPKAETVKIRGKRMHEIAQSTTQKFSDSGEADVVRNPLCTSYQGAKDLLDKQSYYYGNRRIYHIDHRGDPLLACGDTLWLETPGENPSRRGVLVLSTETEYNGSLRGKLIVKSSKI